MNRLRRDLRVPFFMEIIILMSWSIWKSRNDWIFNNIDPSLWNTVSAVGSSPSHVSQDKHKNKYKVDKGQYMRSFSLLSEYQCITMGVILRYIYSKLSLEFW
jgi:hypothetical protein